MNNLKLLALFCALSFQSSSSPMWPFSPGPRLKTIDEAPVYYAKLAKKLDEQPLFKGTWSCGYTVAEERTPVDSIKILPMELLQDAVALELLNELAGSAMSKPQRWNLKSFGFDTHFRDEKNTFYRQGIELHNATSNTRCELWRLLPVYAAMIAKIKSGWTLTNQKPEIHCNGYPHDPKNWFFLKKTGAKKDEPPLIRLIASGLGVGMDKMYCDCPYSRGLELDKPDDTYEIYLWIKHGALEEVLQKLGIA